MELKQRLYAIERELGTGDGDAYRRHLTGYAVVVVPGQTLDREGTAKAIDASPGWDEVSFSDERLIELSDDAALLVYRFDGTRSHELSYAALMGSVYVRRADDWKLAFHQQTPLS